MLPTSANPRSDPRWAKPRSEMPKPIAHALADRPGSPERGQDRETGGIAGRAMSPDARQE